MKEKLITFWRIMTTGTHNFTRNAWLSIAATAVMVVTLTVMLTALIFNFALSDTLEQVTKKIDVAIFIRDEATPQQVESLQTDLKQLENVQTLRFISKTQALEKYREQNKDNAELLEAVNETENPLPQSVEIQVKDLNKVGPIVELTQQDQYLPIIQDTSYGEDRQKTIQRIGNINRFLTRAGFGASTIFAIIAVLIIFNTIRMAIFSRKDEISIMRLIGATNSYIRGPFLFEAMLDGVIAAVISLSVAYVMLFYGGPKLLSYVDFSATLQFFDSNWTLVGLATIASGMLIGVISSGLAMVRYLKL